MARGVLLIALCFAASLAPVAGAGGKISPVESVVNLIEKLQKQTMEEGKVEAAGYDKFACFCKEQADDKLYSMTTKAEKMSLLDATIKALSGDLVNLNKDISKENKEIEETEDLCEKEQALRDEQHADYVVLRDDLAQAIL